MKYLSIDSAVKNNAVVKMEINDNNEIIIHQTNIFNFCGNKKVKQCSFESIIDNLIKELDKYDFTDIDMVLIENIPSRLNQLTKSISIATYAYIKTKKINAKLISPSKKLSKEENKLKYNDRKVLSIKKAFDLINKDDKKKIMNEYNKVDDIADCICMCHSYHINKK
jgi:hypothetical protein